MARDRFSISSKDLNVRSKQTMERIRESLPGEFCAPLFLLRIDITHGCYEDTFQLLQPRDKLVGLLLDIFVLLGDCQWRVEAVWGDPTSQCLMTALTPPRADLRGGNQSDDSFPMPNSTLAQSPALCTFSTDCQNFRGQGIIGRAHSSPELFRKAVA